MAFLGRLLLSHPRQETRAPTQAHIFDHPFPSCLSNISHCLSIVVYCILLFIR